MDSTTFLDHLYKVNHYLQISKNVRKDDSLTAVQKRLLFEQAINYFNEMKHKFPEVVDEIGLHSAEKFMTNLRLLSESIHSTTFFLYPELYPDHLTSTQIGLMLHQLHERPRPSSFEVIQEDTHRHYHVSHATTLNRTTSNGESMDIPIPPSERVG